VNIAPEFDEALRHSEAGELAEAFRLWKLLSDRGDDFAHVQAGLCYEHAMGTEQNLELAAIHYQRGVANGDPEAQSCLGTLYRDGRGVPNAIYVGQR
jgi:uncharacterized protein